MMAESIHKQNKIALGKTAHIAPHIADQTLNSSVIILPNVSMTTMLHVWHEWRNCAPCKARTCDLTRVKGALWPTELRVRWFEYYGIFENFSIYVTVF